MKKKAIFILLISSLFILIVGCSSNSTSDRSESKAEMNQNVAGSQNEVSVEREMDQDHNANSAGSDEISTDRMIIHTANLHVNVKDLEQTQTKIEKRVNEYGGYIVESNVYRADSETLHGTMTIRIPEKHFQTFLTDTENESADVLERVVTGQDVTEEYVDLESRLKSKRVVEERLLDFMGKAEKTEDLLKISSDLAKIQEEIEVIVGKMKYLENQTAYSTIVLTMYESRVIVPGIDGKDLDTWEKVKKQLATSTNFILVATSGLIVFFIGNLPVFIVLLLVGLGVYLIIRRKKKDNNSAT